MNRARDDDGDLPAWRALPVDGEDLEVGDDDGAAVAYLRGVREEASGIPDVIADDRVNCRAFDHLQMQFKPRTRHVVPCHPDLLPCSEWQAAVVAEFEAVRRALADAEAAMMQQHAPPGVVLFSQTPAKRPPLSPGLPALPDTAGWLQYCFGRGDGDRAGAAAGAGAGVGAGAESGGHPPQFSVLVQLDHTTSLRLLQRLVSRITSSRGPPSLHVASWAFALMAKLDVPLLPDTASLLRNLFKSCTRLRAGVWEDDGVADGPPPTATSSPELARINVLCALVAFFGQAGP